MTTRDLYDLIRNFDRRVYRRFTMPQHRPYNPIGGEVVKLPPDYLRWADSASSDDVAKFWELIATGAWRKAKRLSGLPASTIARLMEAFFEETALRGSASPDQYAVAGIALTRFKALLREADPEGLLDKYFNNDRSPPFNALPKKAVRALKRLRDLIEEEKQ